jgi:hypothetical protein
VIYTKPNPNLKKILTVGAAFVIAALLIIALPLWIRNYNSSTSILNPTKNSPQQQRIQKEFEKLEAMRKSTNAKTPTQEEIQKGFAELEKQRAQSNTTPPTQEQIQAEFLKLEQMRKK